MSLTESTKEAQFRSYWKPLRTWSSFLIFNRRKNIDFVQKVRITK